MTQQIKLRVRPDQTVRFPGRCVHCGRPATERLGIVLRKRRVTRSVEMPVCSRCKRDSQRRSGREERMIRLGWLAIPLAAILVIILAWLFFGSLSTWLRGLMALVLGLATAVVVLWGFRRMAQSAELPEKRRVLNAARIRDYTWRTMTFDFVDATFAAYVSDLNIACLVDEPMTAEA